MMLGDVLKLWAKSDRERPCCYHPVLYHCADVALVARILWLEALGEAFRSGIGADLGVDDEHADGVVAFLAGLHDLGKASPAFQRLRTELAAGLDDTGLELGSGENKPHGAVTSRTLHSVLSNDRSAVRANGMVAAVLAAISGAHHGVFASAYDVQGLRSDSLGDEKWNDARLTLADSLWRMLDGDKDRSIELARDDLLDPATVPMLAGLISVADWIGSNTDYFQFDSTSDPISYYRAAESKAREALLKIGWLPSPVYAAPASFAEVFQFTPNTLQRVVGELVDKQTGPFLIAIEARMGQGKTEAALYAADSSLCGGTARGLYVALPTQATSNAMFGRVQKDYLSKRGHSYIKENFQLVHGNALLNDIAQISSVAEDDINSDNIVSARSWFTARKRPLLAPFGVGTIDQALMSVLQTRHWFVRLFGLANKVVVFDEVHAYDTYTSTLLDRLIEWLSALRCTVILLSATLPRKRLGELVAAYSGRQLEGVAEYPRITLADRSERTCVHVEDTSEPMPVMLEFKPDEASKVARLVLKRLAGGGCAAVICNTVDRAQNVRNAIRDELDRNEDECELILFHARTPFGWRKETEEEVLRKFGKPDKDGISPDRPHKAVVVGTSVIEQSLDLDFDWILTDMAPIDLVLQRLGREHRHRRPHRPAVLASPTLTILSDGEVGGPPPKFESAGIYERYAILRSWLAIAKKSQIVLPNDIDPLVQWVYGDEEPEGLDAEWTDELRKSRDEAEFERMEAAQKAKKLLAPKPDYPEDIIAKVSKELGEDDDPNMHESVKAATRDGDPSIQIVCLIREGGKLFTACNRLPVDPRSEPDRFIVPELVNSSLSIQKKGLFHVLKQQDPPPGWKKNPNLRYSRAIEFVGGVAIAGWYRLELSRELGLVIMNAEKKG